VSGKLLSVIEYPDATLMASSVPVNLDELDQFQELIDDMVYTMFYHEGVGLAAPQVGQNVRIFILDQKPINGNKRTDPWVFINPVLEPVDDNRLVRPEGCLSFPGLLAEVARAEWVKVTAFDREGKEFTMDASYNHLFSVALQHEYDHLEGTLLSDRAKGKDRRKIQAWAANRA
jgi:peptide deformylase